MQKALPEMLVFEYKLDKPGEQRNTQYQTPCLIMHNTSKLSPMFELIFVLHVSTMGSTHLEFVQDLSSDEAHKKDLTCQWYSTSPLVKGKCSPPSQFSTSARVLAYRKIDPLYKSNAVRSYEKVQLFKNKVKAKAKLDEERKERHTVQLKKDIGVAVNRVSDLS